MTDIPVKPKRVRKPAKSAAKPAAEASRKPGETAAVTPAAEDSPISLTTFEAKAQTLIPATSEYAPEDEAVIERVAHSSGGVGWILITAGVVGMVVPGVLGTPFLILGGLALWPGNRKRIEHWRQGHSPKIFHGAMKQINRFLNDLDKRYPYVGKSK